MVNLTKNKVQLDGQIAPLSRPYQLTKSRLGTISRIYDKKYLCNFSSLKDLVSSIIEKVDSGSHISDLQFSFLISFSDKTHIDGTTIEELISDNKINTSKLTDRIILSCFYKETINGEANEITLTIRIANPVNPLLYLQAALSKDNSSIVDNIEFEQGVTCVSITGTSLNKAEEFFLRIQDWINSCPPLYKSFNLNNLYFKYEKFFDLINNLFIPIIITISSINLIKNYYKPEHLYLVPVIFFISSGLGNDINIKLAQLARRTIIGHIFELTSGDRNNISKLANNVTKNAAYFIFLQVCSILCGIIASWIYSGLSK